VLPVNMGLKAQLLVLRALRVLIKAIQMEATVQLVMLVSIQRAVLLHVQHAVQAATNRPRGV
jgi:hypothetical protein